MGYYTQFDLSVFVKSGNNLLHCKDSEKIIKSLREYNEDASFALHDNGESFQELKWYDHIRDMQDFSTLYPEHVFVLHGVGEDNEEWQAYFYRGLCQIEVVQKSFEPFDSDRLQKV